MPYSHIFGLASYAVGHVDPDVALLVEPALRWPFGQVGVGRAGAAGSLEVAERMVALSL